MGTKTITYPFGASWVANNAYFEDALKMVASYREVLKEVLIEDGDVIDFKFNARGDEADVVVEEDVNESAAANRWHRECCLRGY